MKLFGISFLSKESDKIVPYIIPLVVLVLAYTLPHSDLITLLFFVLLTLVFSIYRFDPRILIGYAILLFVIEAVLIARNEAASAKLLALLSYWLLVAGIICSLVDLCRNRWPVERVR